MVVRTRALPNYLRGQTQLTVDLGTPAFRPQPYVITVLYRSLTQDTTQILKANHLPMTTANGQNTVDKATKCFSDKNRLTQVLKQM